MESGAGWNKSVGGALAVLIPFCEPPGMDVTKDCELEVQRRFEPLICNSLWTDQEASRQPVTLVHDLDAISAILA